MKLKVFVLSLLVISVLLFISTLGILYAKQNNPNSSSCGINQVPEKRDEKMRNAYVLFLHTDTFEKNEITAELAQIIKTMKWDTLSVSDLSLAFDDWWMTRLELVDSSYQRPYVMMRNRSSHCLNTSYQTSTFIWYYIHSTTEDQHDMDLQWIHFIHTIDTDSLEIADIEVLINDFWSSWVLIA
jgi:hypothetical protein